MTASQELRAPAGGGLAQLLAEGKGYLWALRHAHARDAALDQARAALREAGIDVATLRALRALEPSIAGFPHPTASRPDHRYIEVPIPPDMTVYLAPILTERGVECGTELFPERTTWTFAHHETQYCIGGQTPLEAVLPHGATESRHLGTGDVMAIPAGTRVTYHSTEAGDRFGHAHVYLTNLSAGEPRVYYDVAPFLRLQQLGVLDGADGLPPLHDGVFDRIEMRDWADLATPRSGGAPQSPSWLRNGWDRREQTRALDYHEGTRSLVVARPDREPDAYLPWGDGESRCWVNPLIAESCAAITDCRLPAGYFRSQPATELWTVLRGSARIHQTLAPLHSEASRADVASQTTLVVPGGSRLRVEEASDDLVVRRLAQSCAVNGHWAMMEAKLAADGLNQV